MGVPEEQSKHCPTRLIHSWKSPKEQDLCQKVVLYAEVRPLQLPAAVIHQLLLGEVLEFINNWSWMLAVMSPSESVNPVEGLKLGLHEGLHCGLRIFSRLPGIPEMTRLFLMLLA